MEWDLAGEESIDMLGSDRVRDGLGSGNLYADMECSLGSRKTGVGALANMDRRRKEWSLKFAMTAVRYLSPGKRR